MQRVELKYLEDILMAINEIQEFISGNKKFSYYIKNKMLQRAIERNFEIIGEASKRLKQKKSINKNIKY